MPGYNKVDSIVADTYIRRPILTYSHDLKRKNIPVSKLVATIEDALQKLETKKLQNLFPDDKYQENKIATAKNNYVDNNNTIKDILIAPKTAKSNPIKKSEVSVEKNKSALPIFDIKPVKFLGPKHTSIVNHNYQDTYGIHTANNVSNSNNTIADILVVPKTIENTFVKKSEVLVENNNEIVKAISNAKPRRNVRKFIAPALAGLVLVCGLGIFGMTYSLNRQVVMQVAEATSANENTEGIATDPDAPPSEEPIPASAVRTYSVSPDMPQTIEISKLGVSSRIKRLSILRDGSLGSPGNVGDTGWYEGSSKPGDGGAVLLAAHASGPTLPGVFNKIKNLDVGDIITITRGDKSQFNYAVVKKNQVPADKLDMSDLLIPVTAGKAGLNLITCGGKFLKESDTYQDRVIVYAEQVL